jgi:membrane protein YdbS with pleckstrin-like domain
MAAPFPAGWGSGAAYLVCDARFWQLFFIPELLENGASSMSYVKHVLQPGEKILRIGKKHWFVFRYALAFLITGIILVLLEYNYFDSGLAMIATGILFGLLTLVYGFQAWFDRWTTEIAVTDKRIIYKTGFINRHTKEMNMDKVASVDVDQTVLGRLLDYGSVEILGTGGAGGFERLDMIAAPIKLRNAIDVR